MNKFLLAGCAVFALCMIGAPAFAAPSAGLSANTASDPAAVSTAVPSNLTQMQNEISGLQTQVKALESSTVKSNVSAANTSDNGDVSNIPSGG